MSSTSMRMAIAAAALLGAALLASCGDDSGSSCSNIAGTWQISGACGADTCVVTQSGCSTNFSCAGGTVAYTGSVSGTSVSYGGKTATGADGTCAGTLSGNAITGTCTSNSQTCSFTAQKS
jgi:hypothetical protein